MCSDEDEEEVEESKVTLKQAKESTSLLLRFFEQNETIEPVGGDNNKTARAT